MNTVVIAAAGTIVVGLAIASPLIVVMAPTMVIIWETRQRRAASKRASRDRAEKAIDQVDCIIQHLKGGHSLGRAVAQTYPPVAKAVSAGIGMGDSIDRIQAGQHPQIRLVAATLKLLMHRGGPAMESMERLSDTLRSARRVDLEVATQATQATASATALAALPVVFAVLLALVNRQMALFYLFDPLGAGCAWISAVISFAGWMWMQRLISSASSPTPQ